MVRRGVTVAAATLATLAVGCGGEVFPPAAEPALSPPLTAVPAGRTVAVGAEPEGLAVDGGIAAVVTRDPSALTQVSLDDERVIARTPLPATARHLTLAGPGGPVLIPVEQSDQLLEARLGGDGTRAIAVGDHPHDAVAAAGRIFVGDEFSDQVTVLTDDRVTASLDAPVQPGGLAATNGYVAVVAVAERVLAVYDATSLEEIGELGAGEGPTHVVAAAGRAWVADTDGDSIRVYAVGEQPRAIASASLDGSPYGLAIDPLRMRLWATLPDRNQVVVFDVTGNRPRELRRYPTLRQPNSVAIDARDGRAVIAGRAAGRLELIRGPR